MYQTNKLISIKEAAERLNVHQATVHSWRRRGYLASVKLPNGRYMIPSAELDRVMNVGGADER